MLDLQLRADPDPSIGSALPALSLWNGNIAVVLR
jgi:hypothetical protein